MERLLEMRVKGIGVSVEHFFNIDIRCSSSVLPGQRVQMVNNLSVIWGQLKLALVALYRLFEPGKSTKSIAHVAQCFRKIWFQLQGVFITSYRIRSSAQRVQGNAQVVERLMIPGRQGGRPLHGLKSFLRTPSLSQNGTQNFPCQGMFWILRRHLLG